ncbi:MAG TPA: hypothetical protein ENK43_14075 [Planctomycetes bacterium]|nr:hypothetical protein [Planctomycetota bacterium]
MRIAAVVVAITLAVLGLFAERRATQCGGGLMDPDLPYGLRADWFNGRFWLTDSEGWGVIAPPFELEIEGDAELSVRGVRRYLTDLRSVVAEVELKSGDLALIAVDRPHKSTRVSRLEPGALRTRAGADMDSIHWIDVRSRNCFFGMFWFVRVLLVTGIVGMLVLALRTKRKE